MDHKVMYNKHDVFIYESRDVSARNNFWTIMEDIAVV